jgi:hypothetical protein
MSKNYFERTEFSRDFDHFHQQNYNREVKKFVQSEKRQILNSRGRARAHRSAKNQEKGAKQSSLLNSLISTFKPKFHIDFDKN